MPQHKITKRIYKLHLSLYRELNDIHIFLSRTKPLLIETAERYRNAKVSNDKTFAVPGREGKLGIAKRTPKEVAEIFDRFASRDLNANMLLVCISRLESFLNDVLRVFLHEYPEKLSVGLKGGESLKQVKLDVILESSSLSEARRAVAESRLQGVFYAEPKDYLKYFQDISGVSIPENSFNTFVEAKATRDLIVHNAGEVNELYIRKAGVNARGEDGDQIPLDDEYFSSCISAMKSICSEVKKQVEEKFEKT